MVVIGSVSLSCLSKSRLQLTAAASAAAAYRAHCWKKVQIVQ